MKPEIKKELEKYSKSLLKTTRVKIPIYFGTLVICYSDDLNKVIREHGLTKPNDLEYDIFAFDKEVNGCKEYWVVMRLGYVDLEMIVHECTHIVNYIYVDTGIQLDRINDEPQAYLTGWVFGEIYKTFDKVNKKLGN